MNGLERILADVILVFQKEDLPELKFLVERRGFTYQAIEAAQVHLKDLEADMLLFNTATSDLVDAEFQIKALREKYTSTPIVAVCQEEEISQLETRLNRLDRMHFLNREKLSYELPKLFEQFLLKKPLAVVYTEEQSLERFYKDVLKNCGFDVRVTNKTISAIAKADFLVYKSFKVPPKVIVLDGRYVRKIRKKLDPLKLLRELYPQTDIISVGELAHQRKALIHGNFFIARALQNPDTRAIRQGLIRYVQPSPEISGKSESLNSCFILAGPTCSGKTTVACDHNLRADKRITYCLKYTTRPRRPSEIPNETFVFINDARMDENKKNGMYFVELPPYKNFRYAIPKTASDALKSGKDVLVTTTSLEMTDNIAKAFEKISNVVPILFYANLSLLEERLVQRSSLKEAKERLKTLPQELDTFLKNADRFKYAIDTTYITEEEGVNAVKAIIEWERYHRNKSFVDTIVNILFGPDFFIRWMNEKIFLQFEKGFLVEYVSEKEIPSECIEKISKIPVAAVCPRAYGRASVFFEIPKDVQLPPPLNIRNILLDLIERRLAAEHIFPRHRNNISRYDLISFYGACEIIPLNGGETRIFVNDGLFYRLGDEFTEKQVDAEKRHAISFGFVKDVPPHDSTYRGAAIKKEEIKALYEDMWRGFNALPHKFTASARDRQPRLLSQE